MSDFVYCGFDCRKCPVYVATINCDENAKKSIAEKYSEGGFSYTTADINCLGCKSSVVSPKFCGDCTIRRCAKTKGLAHCGECENYPCEVIIKNIPEDSQSRKNLDENAKKLR